MKKVLAIILCMTMILSLGACSSSKQSTDEPEKTEEKVLTIEEAIDSVEGLRTLSYSDGYVFTSVESDYATLRGVLGSSVWYDDGVYKIKELHEKLGFSGALMDKIESTRNSEETHIEENENYKVTWSHDIKEATNVAGIAIPKRTTLNIIYELK